MAHGVLTAAMRTMVLVPTTSDPAPVRPTGPLSPGAVPSPTDRSGALERLVGRLPLPDHPLVRRHVPTAIRMGRSLIVSAGTTLLSAVVLVVLAVGAGVPPGVANVVGTLCGIGPSYVFNRRYAWRREGRGDLRREVVPFWVLSLTGLVVSTVAVGRVGSFTTGMPDVLRAVALPLANVSVFAVLWLVQFVVLDRIVFRDGAGGGDRGGRSQTDDAAASRRATGRTSSSPPTAASPATANATR